MKPLPEEDPRPASEEPVAKLDHPVRTTNKETAAMARGWAIAMNFVFGVMGMGAIGWAIQTWVWKSAAPWPIVVGLGMGLVGGFYRFIKEAIAAANE